MLGKTLFNSSGTMVLILACVLLFVTGTFCRRRPEKPRPTVEISTGKIRGENKKTRQGSPYMEFLGIPYGKPPIGDLRFEAPQPAEPWKETMETNMFQSECMQMDVIVTGRVIGHENCLFLNVFTAELQPQKLKPVLVFLHGGFFMSGSADRYRGKYFMDEEVVLVTLNYRLGALGFLSTGDGLVRGNMGLKDQILALKWVQQNIANFGGDPKRVTLFGESAGAACVQYLMLSPLANGLFHKSISQSGTATRVYLLTHNQNQQAQHFASKVDCPTTDSETMIKCLKKTSADTLVRVHREAVSPERNKFSIYGPIVEHLKDSEAVMTENPITVLESGNFARIPWMAGVNSGEGLMYVAQILRDPSVLGKLDEQWTSVFPKILRLNPTYAGLSEKVRNYYFGNSRALNIRENIRNFTDMFSDRFFFQPIKQSALLHSKYAPAYLYYFSYKSPVSLFDLVSAITPSGGIYTPEIEFAQYFAKNWIERNILMAPTPFYGACHGDELSILFNTHNLAQIKRRSQHYGISRSMVRLWADFATKNGSLSFQGAPWNPIQPGETAPSYMELNNPGKLIAEPFTDRLRFWDSLNIVD